MSRPSRPQTTEERLADLAKQDEENDAELCKEGTELAFLQAELDARHQQRREQISTLFQAEFKDTRYQSLHQSIARRNIFTVVNSTASNNGAQAEEDSSTHSISM